MEPRHLFTIKWTQPYATYQQRPYLRGLQENLEQLIEITLDQGNFKEAKETLERIMKL